VRDGRLDSNLIVNKPTHIIDIYKMRRGQYKNVRIWLNLHLGTGYRKDLFITNADNCPISTSGIIEIVSPLVESPIKDWEKELKC
jgi:hypothetical protein